MVLFGFFLVIIFPGFERLVMVWVMVGGGGGGGLSQFLASCRCVTRPPPGRGPDQSHSTSVVYTGDARSQGLREAAINVMFVAPHHQKSSVD